MTWTSRVLVAIAIVGTCLALTRPNLSAQTSAMKPVRFTALAVNFDAPAGAPISGTLDVNITRWSTEAERERLFAVLLEKNGGKQLLDLLRDMKPVGSLSTPGNIGYDLRYASHTGAPGGADSVLAITDRPIGFGELATGARTLDYPFTVVELKVNSAGKGEGRVLIGARLAMDRLSKTLIVEDYNIRPVKLTSVKRDSRH